MMDRERYKSDGFVLEKRFFDPAEVAAIRDDAKQVFIAQMVRLGIVGTSDLDEAAFEDGMFRLFDADVTCFANCGKQAQHLISLHRLSLDRRLTDAIEALGLTRPNISTRPLLYFNSRKLAKKEVYWRLSVHQDWRSMQGSLDSLVVWLPLTRIDKALGALEVIPGSHKWGLLPSKMGDGFGHIDESIQLPDFTPVEVDLGDALFFSAFLLHQSGTNVTESIRWSCHFRYNDLDDASFIKRGYPHPYLYKPQEELITPDFPRPGDVERLFTS